MSIERAISYERLTTPPEHLSILIEPDADAVRAMIATDSSGALRNVPLLNTSIAALRRQLRTRLRLAGPVILTGHQAEFCHAGVFAKTIAANVLATQVRGASVFLSVDSDLPKITQLTVPQVERDEVQRRLVAIPACERQLPMEWQPHVPRQQWRDFFGRVAELIGAAHDTLLPTYMDGVSDSQQEMLHLCGVVGLGHAAVNRALGLEVTSNVSGSGLSQTPEFRAFVAHLVLDAGRFAEAYNGAQRAYRIRHREHAPQRPVPLLAVDGGHVELALWVCRRAEPRRRFMVAVRGEHVDFFAGGRRIGSEPLSRLCRADDVADGFQIEDAGWHLRPRALTLSAFVRLFVSDLFVHGIGGAKYDEMTEDFVRRFFGVESPAACCVSATLHLPLPRYGVDREMLAAARHARRDLRFNPQRHLQSLPPDLLRQRVELIEKSNALRSERPSDRTARRHVFNEIRAINHQLLHGDPKRAAVLEQEWRLLERHWRSDRVALDREYFFAMHPRSTIQELVRRIRAALGVEAQRGLPQADR